MKAKNTRPQQKLTIRCPWCLKEAASSDRFVYDAPRPFWIMKHKGTPYGWRSAGLTQSICSTCNSYIYIKSGTLKPNISKDQTNDNS